MKEEDEAMDTDGSDNESAGVAPSSACVTSSTNGNGLSAASPADLLSPHRRSLAEQAAIGKAFIKFGKELASGATPLALAEATTSQLSSILSIDRSKKRCSLDRGSSNKSSGSDGSSNSASPLSLSSIVGVSGTQKKGPKPRAADSPGSGSTTSTTTTTGATGRERTFQCPVCHRCFGYKHVLQNHERTHTGEKPFECKTCEKRFTRDHHLKTHMRLHTGEKPYHCTHCDRQFVQVANLRRHLRVHTGERPYACELCESKFSDSNQLKAHMLIHKNEKPFTCEKCQGKFRRRHHLMHHKCPRDEANIGRPRRGRRPRAYDDSNIQAFDLPPCLSPSGRMPPSLAAVSSTTLPAASPLFHPLISAMHDSSLLPHLSQLTLSVRTAAEDSIRDAFRSNNSSPPPAHSASGQRSIQTGNTKSRRKPKTTVRILSDEQRYLLETDTTGMQTQPLNLGVSKAGEVLDLSSRQKSDVESDGETNGEPDWKDSCDDYDEDDDPQDLSSRGAGNGNGNGFHASYHNNSEVKYRPNS